MRVLYVITALFLACAPAAAQQGQPPSDFEQLGKDLLKNIDAWTRQVNEKLRANKPVGEKDFDAIFGESFFSGSEDPLRDMELAQKRILSKISDRREEVGASYDKWMSKKVPPSDLEPEIVSDDAHVTVNLKAPEDSADSMKVDIAGRLIKMSYSRTVQRRITRPDGTDAFAPVTRKQRRAMPVPEGADPASYRVKASAGKLSIIFDRLKKGKQRVEASK